ncbi:MAG: thioredoxin [Clostridia bacterium]|nr:thioredoxin [Clostridia bacterium]
MKEIMLSDVNFPEEVLSATEPVLVDFYADWCGPCRLLSPILAEIAEEGKIKVCKVNVDREPALAAAFEVSSIPLVIAFKDGNVVGTSLGLTTKEKLVSLFN